jgi:hypothetical protein
MPPLWSTVPTVFAKVSKLQRFKYHFDPDQYQFQLINSSTHQLINSSTHQLINSSTHQLINSSTHQLINSSTHQLPTNPHNINSHYQYTFTHHLSIIKMVSFRAITVLAFAAVAVAQSTPAEVVANIDILTQKSQALQAPAQSLTIVNGPLVVIGQGPFPQIINGFVDIVSTATNDLQQMQGMTAVAAGAEADAIFAAYRDFVRVHQALLNILTGKAGLFSTVPFIGQPLAAVLRQDEGVLDVSHVLLNHQAPSHPAQRLVLSSLSSPLFHDTRRLTLEQTLAFKLIETVQSQASDLTASSTSLGGSLEQAIAAYEGLQTRKRAVGGSLRARAAIAV